MRKDEPRRAASAVVKRSLLVAGHATSVSLEREFWGALKSIAAERDQSVAALVAEIDQTRQASSLSSAIRVFVMVRFREAAARDGAAEPM